jgi:hypothetical protein
MLRRAFVWMASAAVAFAVDLTLLKTAKDPRVLLDTALACARSQDPANLNALTEALGSPSFLARLDSRADYQGPPQDLRLARVMREIAGNAAAQQVLVALTKQPVFTSFEPRQELLIRSLAAVRPAPEEAIHFWGLHSAPSSPYLHVTMDALADNLSEPALRLLEKRVTDPRYDRESRIAWMRDPILRHRTDLAMLLICEHMLTTSLPAAMRPALVEALCDYRREWYGSETRPRPPELRQASPEARAELRKICELALGSIRLSEMQKAAVRKTLGELAG